MSGNPARVLIFVFFVSLVILFGSLKSFAQTSPSSDEDNSSSDIEDRGNKTQEAMDQIMDLELKPADNPGQPKALAKALKQIDDQTAASEMDVVNTTPHEATVTKVSKQTEAVSSLPITGPVQQPAAPVDHVPGWKFNKVNQFELAPEFSYIHYREPGFMREKGPFFGIYGAYYSRPTEYQNYPINVFHIDAHLNTGIVNYQGSGVTNGIHDYLFEPRTWVGRDFNFGPNVQLTPYAGVGYRLLYDSLSKASNGGYDRRSQYLYVPVGIETKFQLSHGWQMGINGEYDTLIRGWQTSYLSDADPFFPNVHNVQHNGYGLRGSIDFVKKIGRFNFTLSPYIRYWNIKRSAIGVATNEYYEIIGFEPTNNSTEVGFRIHMEF